MNSNKEFLEYYDKYKNKIYNYFLYRLNFNKDVAEDMTSEVFIKAFSHFDSFNPDGSFQAWIYAIAHNLLINHWRTANREVSLEYAVNLTTNMMISTHNALELEKALIAIKQMDEYSREVLLLKFVDGFSSHEIAHVLNKNDGAVRTQISRAQALLKEKLSYEKY